MHLRRIFPTLLLLFVSLFPQGSHAQLVALDSSMLEVLTKRAEADPRPHIVMLLPPLGESTEFCMECLQMQIVMEYVSKTLPWLWTLDCDPDHNKQSLLGSICEQAFQNANHAKPAPIFIYWRVKKERWEPYSEEKTLDGLLAFINRKATRFLGKEDAKPIELEMHYWASIEDMLRAVFGTSETFIFAAPPEEDANKKGTVHFVSNQLPVWFNCTEYDLVVEGDADPAALLIDFFPTPKNQLVYSGKKWSMGWELTNVSHTSIEFFWWDLADPENRRLARLRSSDEEGATAGRKCKLPWDRPGDEVENTVTLSVEEETYDWMRFRFLEFADRIVDRVVEREAELLAEEEVSGSPVFLDPMCGTGWMPLLIKARIPGMRVVCNELHQPSAELARSNFKDNGLDGGLYLSNGDFLEPVRKRIAEEPALKPRYVFVLPPQHELPEDFDGNGMLFFVPRGEEQEVFFKRLAKELPELLAADAIVWISAAFELVESVEKVFADEAAAEGGNVWPKHRVLIASTSPENVGVGGDEPSYFGPTGLIEFDWKVPVAPSEDGEAELVDLDLGVESEHAADDDTSSPAPEEEAGKEEEQVQQETGEVGSAAGEL